MVSEAESIEGTGEPTGLSTSTLMHFQVELALRAALMIGWRVSESIISTEALDSNLLVHGGAVSLKLYIGGSAICPAGQARCFAVGNTRASAGEIDVMESPMSPFAPIREEMDRDEALFAHLGALRAQLQ